MAWAVDINSEQLNRWYNPESLFSKLLENQFMLDKSILSRNWISQESRKDCMNLVLSLIKQEFDPDFGISIIHYSPSLHYARLATDELNDYELKEQEGEYFLVPTTVKAESFRLKNIFNVIIDEPEACPVMLFEVTTNKLGVGGLIGIVLNEHENPPVKNLIAGITQSVLMFTSVSSVEHVLDIEPIARELLEKIESENQFDYTDDEESFEEADIRRSVDKFTNSPFDPEKRKQMRDVGDRLTEAESAFLIAIGLNHPVTDDYYKKQLSYVVDIILRERSMLGK